MSATVTIRDVLTEFLVRARLLRAQDESEPVPADDPQRDPNYCWTHGQVYPACAGQHEEQK